MKIGNRTGGKGNLYQHIINLQPPHTVYIEPFLGGGSVMLHKRPAVVNVGIDMDGDVVDAWRDHIVSNVGGRATPETAMGAALARIGDGAVPPKLAMAPGTSPKITRSADNAISDDGGHQSSHLTMLQQLSLVDTAVFVDGSCNVWCIVRADAIELLKWLTIPRDTLIYADPPYPRDVCMSQRDLYTHMMSDEQHVELINTLKSLSCDVQLSSYWSDLYGANLANWHTHTITAYTRSHRQVTEWLWMNYPEPNRLHTYRHLGDDFRERERIKRKAKRNVDKFLRMDRLERLAILKLMRENGVMD